MLSIFAWVFGSLLLGLSVQAQQWCDPLTKICFARHYDATLDTAWGYLFPPLQLQSTEFIGFFIAPTRAGWIGNSLGGGMRDNPLITGWLNGSSPVITIRRTPSYTSPITITAPTLTVLGTSGVNATHQRIVYRCQGCTTWFGGAGGINLNGTHTFGFATHASLKPNDPADPDSYIPMHTLAGQHSVDVPSALTPLYSTYLVQLQNAPPLSGGTPTTTSTTVIPTPTGSLSCPGAPQPSYAMTVASGWRGTTLLGELTSPRGIILDSRGNLLVVERGKGITIHSLDATGCVVDNKTLIADTTLNHGIDINAAGNKLVASSSDIAWSWDYDAVTQSVSNKKTLVTGMNNPGHVTRTLLFSRKYPDLLAISVGSDGNVDVPSFSASVGRATIRVFDLRTLPTDGAAYTSSYGKVLGYGLRNDVGIAEDRAGILHSIENSVDNAFRTINGQQVDVHNDNPAEKVYRLGDPTNPRGIFGGYPYCFTVWEQSNFQDTAFQPGDWFVQAPNSTMNDAWCNANAQKPTVLLPPHTAPLDFKFGIGSDSDMYAALHGSWNRNPPQGYKVVTVPGRHSSTGEWSPSNSLAQTKTTFVDLLQNSNESACIFGCFRPVGLVFNSVGKNLYVSSDTTGEVFLLKKNAGGSDSGTTTTTTRTISHTTTLNLTTTSPTTTTSRTATVITSQPPVPTQTLWGQCGGNGWTGATICATGSKCSVVNSWYHQCLPN